MHAKQRQYHDSLEDADAAIAFAPQSSVGFKLRGKSLLEVERYTEAARAFGEALSITADDDECTQLLPRGYAEHNSSALPHGVRSFH